jgi:tRNA(Arg) A34 adenosine deaminase TadA
MVVDQDLEFIRQSIAIAWQARNKGNHPFGALLVSPDNQILLEAENTVVTDQDITGHAETNLIRSASREYSPDYLKECTLYASTEPCPMCAGAIFWSNIRRVVFGLSENRLYEIIGEEANEEILALGTREVFQKGKKSIEVIGPLLEEEAEQVHLGFWTKDPGH